MTGRPRLWNLLTACLIFLCGVDVSIAQQTQSPMPGVFKLWFSTSPIYYAPREEAEAVCRAVVDGPIPAIDYTGTNFDRVDLASEGNAYCYDSFNHTHQVRQSCIIDENNNGVFDTGDVKTGLPCNAVCPYCSMTVGNPTQVPSGVKIETAVDWVSPKDGRLALRRTYRSDGALAHRYFYRGVYAHQGVWMSDFDETLFYASGGYPAWTWNYHRRDGVVVPFHPPVTMPNGEKVGAAIYHGNPMRFTDNNGLRLREPSGRTVVFRGSYDIWQLTLSEILWPDGYNIKLTRVPGDGTRVNTITDNRGQRLQYVWTNTPVAGVTSWVISRVNIDTNFNGTTFAPDYAIDYTYRANPFEAQLVLIDEVSFHDYQTATSTLQAKYDYDLTRRVSGVPLLLKTYDGRRDAGGQLIPYGSFTYELDGRLVPVVTSSGHAGGADAFSFRTLPTNGNPTSLEAVNALGHKLTYTTTETAAGPKISLIAGSAAPNVAATSKSFNYTPAGGGAPGYVYSQTERNGSRTDYLRDANGLVLTKTENANGANPRVTGYTWNTTLRLPLTRTSSELAESFAYSTEGLLTGYTKTDTLAGSPTFGQARTWSYGYTTLASGLKVLTSVDGPGLAAQGVNDVTIYAWDSQGKLTSVTDPNGLVTTVLSYDGQGQPTKVRNPDTTEWTFVYDARGRIAGAGLAPAGGTPVMSVYAYDVQGQLLTYTNTLNRSWSFGYDAARRLTRVDDPSGDRASYAHDLLGNVTRVEYSAGAAPAVFWEDSAFDALGRLLRTIRGNGQTWTYSHDVEDNLATIADPLTAVETNGFDALNRLVSTVDRGAFTTTKAYNDADRLTGYTDPRSLTTAFTYNGFGEVIAETSPDRGTLSYAYNTRGLPVSRTDARGQTLLYSYDNGGRLTAIDYPGGTAQDLAFTHDIEPWAGLAASSGKGRLARVADSFLRSDFGHATTTSGTQVEERRFYPNARQYDTTASYDLEGNLTALHYAVSNDRLSYDRDADGRVTRIRLQLAGSGPDITLIDNVTWKPNGPLATLTYGDGFTQTRSYDASYRLTGITDGNGLTTLRQLGYAYDSRDNLTAITDALAPALSESFSYTAREHLAGASGPYGAYGFTYDGTGNRLSHSLDTGGGAQVDSYAYPAGSNRLASVALGAGGTRSLGYDAAGNVISDSRAGGPYGYSYDAAGRLASVAVGGVVQAEYRYNHLGQQAVRSFPGSGQSIHSVYGPDGNRIAEFDGGTGALIREYVWLDGAPVAVIEGGQVYFVRSDHIGRPVFATTQTGTVVWTASWLPFGGVHVTTGAPIEARFPGQWFQMESGLHQNWMRDYDPTTGRYIEPDPLGLVDGASVYGYARGNPGRWVDPRGEFGAAGALVGGGFSFGLQFVVNSVYGGMDWRTAIRCVDLVAVANSAIASGLGAGFGSLIKAGRYGDAVASAAITSQISAAAPDIMINDFGEEACADDCKLRDLPDWVRFLKDTAWF